MEKQGKAMRIIIKSIKAKPVVAKPVVLFSGDYTTRKDMIEAAVRDAVSLRKAYLAHERLRSAALGGLHAPGADFECSDFQGADLFASNLRGSSFGNANLANSSLLCADLQNCNLYGADCTLTDFAGANLSGAVLYGAKIIGSNFGYSYENNSETQLEGALVGAERIPLIGKYPIMHVCVSGSYQDWITAFWCGKNGMRISTPFSPYQRTVIQYLNAETGETYRKRKLAIEFAEKMLKEQN